MDRPATLVLAPLPDTVHPELESAFECVHAPDADTLQQVLNDPATSARIRAVVGHGGSRVSAAMMDSLPQLKIISLCAVGYDGVDVEACRSRGIRLTNTPDVLTDDVADIAAALVLMTSRRLLEANRFLHSGAWPAGPFPLASTLRGKTAGIVGLGRIGKAIALRLQAFGMLIAYHGRRPQPVPFPYQPSLVALAQESDFLVLACPGGKETWHLVDDAVLGALGHDGVLVNIARGPVVDEVSLVRRLVGGQLGGVGLDVFEHEPHVPAELLSHPRAVLLPHVGSATVETRTAMGRLCLDNLHAHFSGQPLLTPVV